MAEKICKICNESKQLSGEFWHKCKGVKDGFVSRCKVCANKNYKRIEGGILDRQEHKKKFNEKRCPSCKNYLSVSSEFWHKNSRNSDGFADYCKKCTSTITYKNRDKNSYRRKIYYQANRDIVKRKSRQWAINNPVKASARGARYRARKKSAVGSFSTKEILGLYEKQNYRCFHCGVDIFKNCHIDHWIPLSKSGSNYIENIRLLCPSCNCSKNDKLPKEFNEKYVVEENNYV